MVSMEIRWSYKYFILSNESRTLLKDFSPTPSSTSFRKLNMQGRGFKERELNILIHLAHLVRIRFPR